MAPDSKQTPVPASQAPAAQQAADLLWRFQLRKEHDQLISKLNKHQEQLSTFVTDTRRNCEKLYAKLDAVEKKVKKLETDDKRLSQDSSKLHDELQALKEKVGLITTNAERSRKENIISSTSKNVFVAERGSNQETLSSSTRLPDPIPRISSSDTEKSSPEEAARGPLPQVAVSDQQVSSRPVSAEQAKLLRQGTLSLEEYLLVADRLVANLPPKSTLPRTENEFVKKFITGLTNDKERDILIKVLQQQDLWTVVPSSNGKKNICIRWLDFKEGVRRSKLIDTMIDMEPGVACKEVQGGESVRDFSDAAGSVSEVAKKQEKGHKQKKRRT